MCAAYSFGLRQVTAESPAFINRFMSFSTRRPDIDPFFFSPFLIPFPVIVNRYHLLISSIFYIVIKGFGNSFFMFY